jgi:hypothetical protein
MVPAMTPPGRLPMRIRPHYLALVFLLAAPFLLSCASCGAGDDDDAGGDDDAQPDDDNASPDDDNDDYADAIYRISTKK